MSKNDADKQPSNSKAIGRPFPKGVSGNPKGRPPKGKSLTELMGEYLEGSDKEDGVPRKLEFIARSYKLAKMGDPTFAKLIWNYLDGMPKHTFEHSGQIVRDVTVRIIKDATELELNGSIPKELPEPKADSS